MGIERAVLVQGVLFGVVFFCFLATAH
jgi:hypothetical protein